MKNKKPAPKRMSCGDSFNIKSNSPARALTIEGFANKAIIDRGGDLIPPEAWELSEFKDNNILLFNHNQDLAIGTAEVKVTENGLQAKAKISKSNEAPLPYIRDMIKEGIIKSFSVGFDPKDSAAKSEDGTHTVLNKANLLELSVVTVPMNQASTFTVTNEVDKCISNWKTKSYHEARSDMLLFKGAFLARTVHDRLAQLQEERSDFDREEVLDRILTESGASEKELDDLLAGNTKKISDSFLEVISKNLDLDSVQLRSLDAGDGEGEKGAGEEEEADESEAKTVEDQDSSDKQVEDDESDEEKKLEDDEEKNLEEDKEDEEEKSFKELVSAKIKLLIADGMENDQAIAVAVRQTLETFAKDQEILSEDLEHFIKVAGEAVSETKDTPTVNLDNASEALENVQVSNPSMDQFKAQTTLLAQNNNLLEQMVGEIRGLRSDLQNEKPDPETVENSREAEDLKDSEAIDAKAKRMAEYKQQLEEIAKLIN